MKQRRLHLEILLYMYMYIHWIINSFNSQRINYQSIQPEVPLILFLFYMALNLYIEGEGASTDMQARNVKLGQKTVTCYPVVNQNDKILLELLVELSVGIRERVAVGSIDWLGYQCRKVLYRKIKILLVLSFEKSITIIIIFFFIC